MKKMWNILFLFVIVPTILCSCGWKSPSGLSVKVIGNPMMGDQWSEMFEQGAREELDNSVVEISVESESDSNSSVADLVNSYAGEGYDGILLALMPEGEADFQAITDARARGVAVISFADEMDNGYSGEAPDALGKVMAQALEAQMALRKGSDVWGDSTDYTDQIKKAVRGTWKTGNSSGDRKQFSVPYVMESSCTDESMGYYELKRVSLVDSITDTEDGKGLDYTLNTGNHYYLYPDNPDLLECHWEPDGYSASDSLIKAAESRSETGENSCYYFDMRTYSDTEEIFQGRISSFTGYDQNGNEEQCLALNLDSPIRVTTADGTDTLVYAIQLNTDFTLNEYVDQGTTAHVKGRLFEAHTSHHYTPVLLDVEQVK